jgi:hypothetical protein
VRLRVALATPGAFELVPAQAEAEVAAALGVGRERVVAIRAEGAEGGRAAASATVDLELRAAAASPAAALARQLAERLARGPVGGGAVTLTADLTPPAPAGSGGGWALLVLLGVGAAAASALALRSPWTRALLGGAPRERVVADADDDESAVDVPVARRVHRVR